MKKERLFGFSLMAIILLAIAVFTPWTNLTNGHIGMIMLSLIVVAMMMGFPSAFTLMGMGVIFTWYAYHSVNPDIAVQQTLDLTVQRTFGVMSSDVLIAVPLFLFMGYLVERAKLIKKLFHAIHIATARIPGSLAVASLVTCAIFATATGIVGAVVTLMGLLALPAMMRAGYDTKLSSGVIAAGGTLGILIPPSIMLIVYGATAGESVVRLYAGAFFPGLLLATLYIVYVVLMAKLKPHWAPPLPAAERVVDIPDSNARIAGRLGGLALPSLVRAAFSKDAAGVPRAHVMRQLAIVLLPAIVFILIMGLAWNSATKPKEIFDTSGLQEMGIGIQTPLAEIRVEELGPGVSEPPMEESSAPGISEPPLLAEPPPLAEPPALMEPPPLAEPPALMEPPPLSEPPAIEVPPILAEPPGLAEPPALEELTDELQPPPLEEAAEVLPEISEPARLPAPSAFWEVLLGGVLVLAVIYGLMTYARLEIFKMLLTSFFPLAVMILGVLGSIVFGLATPSEAAAVGALGGYILAAIYMAMEKPRKQRKKWWPSWIVLWAVFLASVVWFILYKAHFTSQPVPAMLGWTSMSAFLIWAFLASWQANLIPMLKESVFLTAKTSTMVCWLFVGASVYSAAFSLLGGHQVVEEWVLSLNMTPIQFLILTQIIIFVLGWPLEWTEIIVIFMPIFVPLLAHFNIDPLFFGILVALNLQTSFLSPPMAPSAFYLKGVAPPNVSLTQIFLGSMPFLGIVILAMIMLYIWPEIGLWLPAKLYN